MKKGLSNKEIKNIFKYVFDIFKNLAEISLDDRILLLTHTDMDGAGPAILLRALFPNLVVKHCTNAAMDSEIEKTLTDPETGEHFDAVIICDISCKLETAERIDKNMAVKKVVLLDHHITATDLNRFSWAVVCPEVLEGSWFEKMGLVHSSGTSLLYNYLEYLGLNQEFPDIDKAEEFAFLVAGYDTWDWVNVFMSDSKFYNMQTLFEQYDMLEFERVFTEKLLNGEQLIGETEELLLRIARNKKQAYLDTIEPWVKTGHVQMPDGRIYNFAYVQANQYIGDIYNRLKELRPESDFYIVDYGKGVSVRTDKDINLGALAKPLGGGGHPGAAGIRINSDLRLRIMREMFHTDTFMFD